MVSEEGKARNLLAIVSFILQISSSTMKSITCFCSEFLNAYEKLIFYAYESLSLLQKFAPYELML